MLKTALLAGLAAAVATLAACASGGSKEGYEAVILGGDLPGEVVVPRKELARLLSQGGLFFHGTGPDASEPDTIPSVTYEVKVYRYLPNGDKAPYVFLTYFPKVGDQAARFQDVTKRWTAVDPAFRDLLDRYIASALREDS